MKQHDKKIKEILLSKMERVENPNFTENIVNQYLLKRGEKTKYVQFDFTSLIAGLVFIIVLLGLEIITSVEEIEGVTFENLYILTALTVIYLIFRLLNEITTPNKRYV